MHKTSMLAVGLAIGLTAVAMADTRYDYDKNADFASYKTYAWMDGTSPDPFLQGRIEAAIDAQLAVIGLEKSDGEPDVWVVTHASASTETRVDVDSFGYGSRWRGWGPTSVNVRDVAIGSLLVDVVDFETKELVWRGIATDTISAKAKKNEKNVAKAAAKLFKDFPPSK